MSAPGARTSRAFHARADADVTVLVVDDHHSGRYVKTRVLAQAGFHVLEATSGRDAIERVIEHRPTLVVLDVHLPDIDGIAVCRAIKEHPAAAQTMVLQVSAYYTSIEDQVLGLDSGADAYIPGDIAPALLVAAVRALLRTRHAEERMQLLEALDQSQQRLRALAASLFTAQEEERRRIARELHDDFSQRMALVEMALAKLRHEAPGLETQVDGIIGQIAGISEQLRDVSHALHPSGLEHLGLEAGLRSLAEEFERAHDIPIRFANSILERRVSEPAATVFYRIAQEALRNVVKHAGDARVTMTLSGDDANVCLRIADDGSGFDAGVQRHGRGLGMISMQERARLVGGSVQVSSSPGEGTTVIVLAPWPASLRH